VAFIVALALAVAACSREQRDWRNTQAADSIESYEQFLKDHPSSELAAQARTRVEQLAEDRDWQKAGSADTLEAYQQFVSQHPNGKWAQEARIRIENFSLAETQPAAPSEPSGDAVTPGTSALAASAPKSAPAAARPAASPAPAVARASEPNPAPKPAPKPAPRPAATAAEAKAAAAQATKPKAESRGYAVQLGAFTSEDRARKAWQAVSTRHASDLKGLAPNYVAANTSSGRLVRLQASVRGESEARRLCAALKKTGDACVVVPPRS
jgi:cell division septation protein DedD